MKLNGKKAQSILEYFLLLGVLVVIVVAGSGAFKSDVQTKVLEYRDKQVGRIIDGSTSVSVSLSTAAPETGSAPDSFFTNLVQAVGNHLIHVTLGDPLAIPNGLAGLVLQLTGTEDNPWVQIFVGVGTGSVDTILDGALDAIGVKEGSTLSEVAEWVVNPIGKAASTIAGWFGW